MSLVHSLLLLDVLLVEYFLGAARAKQTSVASRPLTVGTRKVTINCDRQRGRTIISVAVCVWRSAAVFGGTSLHDTLRYSLTAVVT